MREIHHKHCNICYSAKFQDYKGTNYENKNTSGGLLRWKHYHDAEKEDGIDENIGCDHHECVEEHGTSVNPSYRVNDALQLSKNGKIQEVTSKLASYQDCYIEYAHDDPNQHRDSVKLEKCSTSRGAR